MTEYPLIRISSLEREFKQRQGLWGKQSTVYAVRGMNLDIRQGETLGVVGESGCGKSTLGRMAIGLLEPSSGDVLIDGKPLYDRKAHADYRAFRRGLAGKVQMIFQDPYSSLNPRMRIGTSVAEPLICASGAKAKPSGKAVDALVTDMLVKVGMDAETARRYPHEFSGGQRQRIAIARALITRPAFVVCDEPTSSLDASVQSQVLNLLQDMQEDLGLTYMFISHDLAVVRHMSDRVAVMYRGFLVELSGTEELFSSPLHPYTRLLLESVPGAVGPKGGSSGSGSALCAEHGTEGERGSTFSTTSGALDAASFLSNSPSPWAACPFVDRCPEAMPRCREGLPELVTLGPCKVRCFLYEGRSQ